MLSRTVACASATAAAYESKFDHASNVGPSPVMLPPLRPTFATAAALMPAAASTRSRPSAATDALTETSRCGTSTSTIGPIGIGT